MQSAPVIETSSRSVALDFLRGVAVLLVVCHHTDFHWEDTAFLAPFAYVIEKAGWTGVDLFFVLSGFLIGGLLMTELKSHGRLNIPRFLVRRGLKIWPAYFVLVLFAFIKLRYHQVSAPEAFTAIVPNLLQIQNYTGVVIGHTWSLAVEEHFYLALPLVLIVLAGRSRAQRAKIPGLVWVGGFVAAGCLSLRCYRCAYFPAGTNLSAATELRIDSLFAGVAVAYFYHFKSTSFSRLLGHRLSLLTVGIALVSHVLIAPSWFVHTFGFTLLYLGYAAILIAVAIPSAESPRMAILDGVVVRWIAMVGMFSYSIYLWHLTFGYPQVEHFVLTHGLTLKGSLVYAASILATIGLAVLVGVVMTLLIERPFLVIRNRFFPSRSTLPDRVQVVEIGIQPELSNDAPLGSEAVAG